MTRIDTAIAADDRWQAVATRARSADGRFVYAVTTTGVYCRPSCPSRRPRAENVRFFATAGEARAGGFRACRRCAPDADTADERHRALVIEACRMIDAAETPPTLDQLARRLGVSPYHFHRQFKAGVGMTPKAYADARRAETMRKALDRNTSVTASIYDAGYGSASRFYEASDQVLGMTPRQYRAQGSGTVMHFAIGQCSLGHVLVAQTVRGVCAILFGDDPEALIRDLQDRFPKAQLVGGDAAFEQTVARVVGLIEHPDKPFDLPLDLNGTLFQQKVWTALRAIPPGTTASYQQIAAAIGAPTAMRAVAQACAANKVAVAIPCHRVVRQDGALSGYRWGVSRKRELLRREIKD